MTEKPLNIEKTKLDEFKEGMLSKIYDGTIKNVWFDTNVKDYRLNDTWFNDTIFRFDYKNLEVRVTVHNDVRGKIITQKWDEESHQSQFHTEHILDKNNSGELGRRLKKLGINKDSEITTKFADFINEKRNDKNEFKIKALLELQDNNWTELVIYNKETKKYIDTYEAYALSEFIDMDFDEFLNLVKEYAGDKLNENFESKEEGSSYKFIQECDYVKAQKTFCDYLNLRYESLEDEGVENIKPFEEWKRTDECKDTRNENYTIEAMFKSRGVAKVFDDRGVFTKEALEKYDEVSDEFFDGITDNLDSLCHEEECFEEDIENNNTDYDNSEV